MDGLFWGSAAYGPIALKDAPPYVWAARKELELSKSNDSFDIDEEWTGPKKSSPAAAPRDLLTGDKVAAVKFNVGKPGYSFGQVEAFVRQVEEALRWHEEQKHRHAVELHEAKDDRLDLEEKIATLQATIEVFRANGDPLVDKSGNYVTQSQVESSGAIVDTAVVDALNAEVARLTAALQAAEAQVSQLHQEVEVAKAATQEAEMAELELRDYINETLLPWIDAANAAAQHGSSVTEATTAPEPVEPSVSAPTQTVVDSGEWEDAPSIGSPSLGLSDEMEETFADSAEEASFSQPAVTPLLVQAPELAGQEVDLTKVPAEEETGRRKGKKKGSLANAPEVSG